MKRPKPVCVTNATVNIFPVRVSTITFDFLCSQLLFLLLLLFQVFNFHNFDWETFSGPNLITMFELLYMLCAMMLTG